MITTITTFMLSVADSFTSIGFVLLIMPKRKEGKWNLSVIPLAILLSFLYLIAVSNNNNLMILILEYGARLTPIAIYCAGDFWRNILIRFIYEAAVNLIISIRGPLNLFVEEEKKYRMLRKTDSIGFCISYILLLAFAILILVPLFRAIIKRWSPEFKIIYPVLMGIVCLMGIVNGINMVSHYTKETLENEGPFGKTSVMVSKISVVIDTITVVLINYLYNRWVNGQMKKEKTMLEKEITVNNDYLYAGSSFAEYLDQETKKFENEGISASFVVGGNIDDSEQLRKIISLLTEHERQKKVSSIEMRFVERHGLVMIVVKDETENSTGKAETDRELKEMIEKMGGTAEFGEEIEILVPESKKI